MVFLPGPIKQLNRLRQLTAHERSLLLLSMLLLPLLHLALRLLGYTRLRRILEWMTPPDAENRPRSDPRELGHAQQITRIVTIASQHGVYKASCLRRSLVTWWLLRREGIPGSICFGVRMCGSQLEAHAWVEYKDRVLSDRPDVRQQFQVLQNTLPSAQRGL